MTMGGLKTCGDFLPWRARGGGIIKAPTYEPEGEREREKRGGAVCCGVEMRTSWPRDTFVCIALRSLQPVQIKQH